MDIRRKTLVIFSLGLILILAIFVAYSSLVLYTSYINIENHEIGQKIRQVELVVENELGDLDSRLEDWSRWDATYYFVKGTNPGYKGENLGKDTFSTLGLDYFLIFNRSGGEVFAQAYNREADTLEDISPGMLQSILNTPGLFYPGPDNEDASVRGIIFIEGTPRLIAARPVLLSNGTGPGEGTMIMIRDINKEFLDKISRITAVDSVLFIDPHTTAGNPVLASLEDKFGKGTSIVSIEQGPEQISGFSLESQGTFPGQTYIIQVTQPRDTLSTGRSTMGSFMIVVLGSVLVIWIITLVFLDRSVLRRISTITTDVRMIGSGKNTRIRDLPGDDELTQLSGSINDMLDQLTRSQLRYRSIVEDQSELICRFDRSGTITFMNPAFRSNLGDVPELNTIFDLAEPAISRERFEQGLQSLARESPIRTGETTLRYPEHDIIVAWTIRAIYSDEGELVEYQFVGRDISDRKRAEGALQKVTKKLTLLNYVTFNEIKNAIFTLNGYLSLEKAQEEGVQGQDYLDKAAQSVERIEEALAFSKQYQDLGLRPPLWQNVQESFIMAISHLDTSSLSRDVRVDNLEIYADPLLEKVFLSLAENVVRHSGGATVITLGYFREGPDLVMYFEDNGEGIPDQSKERIFEWGYAGHGGKELFLVREILGITDITIRETGKYGEGARFEILVPAFAFRFTAT